MTTSCCPLKLYFAGTYLNLCQKYKYLYLPVRCYCLLWTAYVAVYDVTYMYTLIRGKLYMRMVELIDTHTPYNIPTGCRLSRVQLVFIKERIMT